MYAETRAKVVTPDGKSKEFDILAGVPQGDTLAPFLFVIVQDYTLRKAINGQEQPKRLRCFPAVVLTNLDYADDISLFSNHMEQAQMLLSRVESECAKLMAFS